MAKATTPKVKVTYTRKDPKAKAGDYKDFKKDFKRAYPNKPTHDPGPVQRKINTPGNNMNF